MSKSKTLLEIYQKMFDSLGPQQWWPGETPFEIIIGAILTQNTNWSNVERAIKNLKMAGRLSPKKIHELALPELAQLIRPSGFFNVKSKRVKTFIHCLFSKHEGKLPTFVVDAYTYRIFARHGLIPEESTYDEIKSCFEENLPKDVKLFNEYHSLFVNIGKTFCKPKRLCEQCPLKDLL